LLPKIKYNLEIALEAIRQNTMRSFLTSLGIIFGVASVIAMLAIGRGAQKKVLQQLQLLGTNNIIIQPYGAQGSGSSNSNNTNGSEEKGSSYGLTLTDMQSIKKEIPHVSSITPEIIYQTSLIRNGRIGSGRLVGVDKTYFDINNFKLAKGRLFSDLQVKHAEPVCVIGYGIKAKFFPQENPIGKKIKAGKLWLKVIGVLERRNISSQNEKKLNIRNYNLDIYSPTSTVLVRYKNRKSVTQKDLGEVASRHRIQKLLKNAQQNGNLPSTFSIQWPVKNYNQLDKLVIQVSDNKYSPAIADITSRLLTRRHNGVHNFNIVVPQQLLKQEQQTQHIFNIVLSAIASISLLVGGIGIMNIMLASVVERYREIGVRRAVGAHKLDINLQFLTEALAISVTGGILGIVGGIVISYIIEISAGITTIITIPSILLSFFVAVAIGIIFGFFPAKKAAQQDPVNALRHE
jgi:putative ABC transport system permease protein